MSLNESNRPGGNDPPIGHTFVGEFLGLAGNVTRSARNAIESVTVSMIDDE